MLVIDLPLFHRYWFYEHNLLQERQKLFFFLPVLEMVLILEVHYHLLSLLATNLGLFDQEPKVCQIKQK